MAERESLQRLRQSLRFRPYHATWAKSEILLGLLAVAVGLWVAAEELHRPILERGWHAPLSGLVLFVLGGYLTLAGHRSHLYQHANLLAAFLSEHRQPTERIDA